MMIRNSVLRTFVCVVTAVISLASVCVAAPTMSNVRFDGSLFVTDDPIAAYPQLRVQVSGVSIDASSFVLVIDGAQVTTINPLNFSYSSGDFIYNVSSRLQPGSHHFILSALDSNDGLRATCNIFADVNSLEQDVIGDPLAIPNPATHNMRITYKLSQPGDVFISIYNLNAEKVWEQELTRGMTGTRAGYNEVVWDLKSGYEDYCPNGVYLCVISKKDDETKRTVMGKIKLFILR